ncbi:MAG TPA: hypothetical protein VNM40_01645 [Candidatus Paceibacterota bacterium]|nr:hypothetical protein [Candidatus Paceibacterota bacterium]
MANPEDPNQAKRRAIIDKARQAAGQDTTPEDTAAKMRARYGSDPGKGPGGALPEHARGTFDAAGQRFLEGMEGVEQTAEALAEFGNTVDKIMTALLEISDLVEYDGSEIKPSVRKYLIEIAQADPKDREALKQRAVDRIQNFIQVVNEAEPIHTKRTQDLLRTLESLSRSLST